MKKKKFLVFQDLSTSGQWLYLYARSKEDIERRFPEFHLFDVPPKRFDAEAARGIENHPDSRVFDIDNLHGLLKDYVENEQKDHYVHRHPDKKRPFVDFEP
ncbi:MAG: hypothetical protein P8H28_06065 [Porticoccaceae bacterium]|nr:hypothetical protein [Porticoccaceae bacterium]